MRFSVDAHAIGRRLTGNEVYVRNLLEGFAALDASSEFIAYVSLEEAAQHVPRRFHVRNVSRNPFVRLGWDLAAQLRRDRPDLVHVQYTAPLVCPVPVVVTVHDVSFLEHPEYFPAARATQLRWTVARTVRRAARILTGSEFSRGGIARAYGISEERITVVPNAAATLFRPLPKEPSAKWVRARFGVPSPYLLTVGDLQPRKNQIGLIRAFGELVRAYPHLPHHLVLAGKGTWWAPRVRKAVEQSGAADRIHFTGFVSDDDLVQLYNACELFVFPSFYEGFGLPVVEAMACGAPVACSNASALVEVADSAAILFDPYSVEEMVRALRDLALDAELRARMGRLAVARSAQFNWQKSAARTLEVYREVARSRASQAHSPVPAGRS